MPQDIDPDEEVQVEELTAMIAKLLALPVNGTPDTPEEIADNWLRLAGYYEPGLPDPDEAPHHKYDLRTADQMLGARIAKLEKRLGLALGVIDARVTMLEARIQAQEGTL